LNGTLSYPKRSSPFLNTLLTIIISLLLFSQQSLFAQYPERLEELTQKLEALNKQIEACGSDIGCIQSKTSQLKQLSKEIQSLYKDLNKNPEKLIEGFADNLPKENEFPPPFDKITKTWLKHTMAASTLLRLKCETINNTREEVLDKIDEIFKKEKNLTGSGLLLPLSHCKETTVNLKEHGILNEPGLFYLDYSLQFTDRAVWIAGYYLIVEDRHINVKEKHSYMLGLADPPKRNTAVLSYDGWIMDQSKSPPVKKPLIRHEILEEELITFIGTQVPSYKGYTIIFPKIIEDPKDKYKVGKVTEYLLTLPYQIVRFYTANPEEYIDNYVEFTEDTFTPEEIQGLFEQGKFKKSYSKGGVTQEIEIGFPPFGCDELTTSSKGAIILSGDCIDHGGYVIANDKTTITVNGKTVAKIGDKVLCFKHGETEIIASGNNNVLSEKKQIAKIGDKTKCGAKILGGSMDTFAGNK